MSWMTSLILAVAIGLQTPALALPSPQNCLESLDAQLLADSYTVAKSMGYSLSILNDPEHPDTPVILLQEDFLKRPKASAQGQQYINDHHDKFAMTAFESFENEPLYFRNGFNLVHRMSYLKRNLMIGLGRFYKYFQLTSQFNELSKEREDIIDLENDWQPGTYANYSSLLSQLMTFSLSSATLIIWASFITTFGGAIIGYLAMGEEFLNLQEQYLEDPNLLTQAQRLFLKTILLPVPIVQFAMTFFAPLRELKREYGIEIALGGLATFLLYSFLGKKIRDKIYEVKRFLPGPALDSDKGIHMAGQIKKLLDELPEETNGKPLLALVHDQGHVMKALVDIHGFELIPVRDWRPPPDTSSAYGRLVESISSRMARIEEWFNHRGI